MKPYMVVKVSEGSTVYTSDPESGRGIHCTKPKQLAVNNEDEYELAQNLYLCNSERDAQVLAVWLVGLFPQHTWMVARATEVYSRPPGELVKASFNEKGLLPT